MKKTILTTILAGSALVLAACGGKSLTVEEAKQYAKEHYDPTVEMEVVEKTTSNITESTGFFEAAGIKKGEHSNERSYTTYPMNADYFVKLPENVKFTLDGGAMTIEMEVDAKEYIEEELEELPESAKDVKGTAKTVIKTDDKGYMKKTEQNVEISFTYTLVGTDIESKLALTVVSEISKK